MPSVFLLYVSLTIFYSFYCGCRCICRFLYKVGVNVAASYVYGYTNPYFDITLHYVYYGTILPCCLISQHRWCFFAHCTICVMLPQSSSSFLLTLCFPHPPLLGADFGSRFHGFWRGLQIKDRGLFHIHWTCLLLKSVNICSSSCTIFEALCLSFLSIYPSTFQSIWKGLWHRCSSSWNICEALLFRRWCPQLKVRRWK